LRFTHNLNIRGNGYRFNYRHLRSSAFKIGPFLYLGLTTYCNNKLAEISELKAEDAPTLIVWSNNWSVFAITLPATEKHFRNRNQERVKEKYQHALKWMEITPITLNVSKAAISSAIKEKMKDETDNKNEGIEIINQNLTLTK
jgi:hypothetical protein